MDIQFKRADGSYVVLLNGLPYHVTDQDPLFIEVHETAKRLGDDLPDEPEPQRQPLTLSVYENALQAHVDDTARSKLFRDGVTLVSYASSTNPKWAAEAKAFIAWRDAVWVHAYAELAKVQEGEREQPTLEKLIAGLPLVTWP